MEKVPVMTQVSETQRFGFLVGQEMNWESLKSAVYTSSYHVIENVHHQYIFKMFHTFWPIIGNFKSLFGQGIRQDDKKFPFEKFNFCYKIN